MQLNTRDVNKSVEVVPFVYSEELEEPKMANLGKSNLKQIPVVTVTNPFCEYKLYKGLLCLDSRLVGCIYPPFTFIRSKIRGVGVRPPPLLKM